MCRFIIFIAILYSVNFDSQLTTKNNSNADEIKSKNLAKLAVTYFQKNDFKKSTIFLFEAKDIAERTKNHELIAEIYGSISHQYVQLNLNDKAQEYLKKAIEEIDQIQENDSKKLLKGLSFIELGNIVFDQKKYLEANTFYKKSLSQFQSIQSAANFPVYHYRRSLFNIGNSYFYLSKSDSAELFLNRALTTKKSGNKELNFFIYNTLSEIYSKEGLYRRAIDSSLKILNDKNFNNVRLKADIYHNLSQNYKNIGDYEKSLFYNESYVKLNISNKENENIAINSAISAEQNDYQNAIFAANKDTKQIKLSLLE